MAAWFPKALSSMATSMQANIYGNLPGCFPHLPKASRTYLAELRLHLKPGQITNPRFFSILFHFLKMLWLAIPLWVIFLLSSFLLSLLVSFCFLEIRDNSFGVLSMTLLKPKGHYNKDG